MTFRLRLTIISVLVVTAVLAAVSVLVWSNVRQLEAERLDAALCMEAKRLDVELRATADLDRLAPDVAAKLRLDDPAALILRRDSAAGPGTLESSYAPEAVALDAIRFAPVASSAAAGSASSPMPTEGPSPRGAPPRPMQPASAGCSYGSISSHGVEWRAALAVTPSGRNFVAVDVDAVVADLRATVHQALTTVVPLALLLVLLSAWLLSAMMMRPVRRLREAMKGLGQKDLSQRLPFGGEDREYRELIAAWNKMLERLEASFSQASRFSADAAHELRTPLTILQGSLERAIGQSENRAIQADLTAMLEDVAGLAAITRKLLLLSQADAGRLTLQMERVDLSEMLHALVADSEMIVAADEIEAEIGHGLVLTGDAVLLRQLFNNVIGNAIRHRAAGGWIKVVARRVATGAEVVVANRSSVIPTADRARLFDRFYRQGALGEQKVEGSGLGLSLAREIARAHGGDLALEPSPLDEVRFRVSLPAR